jgi:hypothetical protein
MQDVQVPEVSIAAIRGNAERKLLDGFLVGLRGARQDALFKLNQLMQAQDSGRVPPAEHGAGNGLFDLRQQYRTLSAKIHAFLARGSPPPR